MFWKIPVHVLHNPRKIKRKHGSVGISEPETNVYMVVFTVAIGMQWFNYYANYFGLDWLAPNHFVLVPLDTWRLFGPPFLNY